jgi:hypothetical protein
LFSESDPPKISREDISLARKRRQRESRVWNLLRAAVRSHKPTREGLAKSRLFQAWQAVRHRPAKTIALPKSKVARHAPKNRTDRASAYDLNQQKYLPNRTFIELFDNQAVFTSDRFRNATGWRPKLTRQESAARLLSWAECYVRGSNADLDVVKESRRLALFSESWTEQPGCESHG